MSSSCHLTHVDPGQNMARFYRMTMQPTLFGEWSLVREFGRIGSPGRVVATNHHTFAQASAALESLRAAKERKGYTAEC